MPKSSSLCNKVQSVSQSLSLSLSLSLAFFLSVFFPLLFVILPYLPEVLHPPPTPKQNSTKESLCFVDQNSTVATRKQNNTLLLLVLVRPRNNFMFCNKSTQRINRRMKTPPHPNGQRQGDKQVNSRVVNQHQLAARFKASSRTALWSN